LPGKKIFCHNSQVIARVPRFELHIQANTLPFSGLIFLVDEILGLLLKITNKQLTQAVAAHKKTSLFSIGMVDQGGRSIIQVFPCAQKETRSGFSRIPVLELLDFNGFLQYAFRFVKP